MRYLLALIALASPASAWDFSPLPICTLSDHTDATQVTVTYDPAIPEYAIAITLLAPNATWPAGPTFTLDFRGTRDIVISTSQHSLSPDNRTLTVRDRGFGNVLDGLQFNDLAIATSGGQSVLIPLTDAANPVARFRDCGATLTG